MSKSTILQDSKQFAIHCDPESLAFLGLMVRQRLDAIPGVERVNVESADLYVVPGFLRKRDCRALVQAINQRAVPSTLYDGDGQLGFRTSHTYHFDRNDPLTFSIESYISDLLGIDNNHSEPIQGQRYQVGQQYKAHHDFFHLGRNYWTEEATRGGQRTWTAMAYLNEPREGGETEFPLLGVTLRPKMGMLVMWNNMDNQGRPNMKTLHIAHPVQRGIKHVITKWYRLEPWIG